MESIRFAFYFVQQFMAQGWLPRLVRECYEMPDQRILLQSLLSSFSYLLLCNEPP